MGYILSGSYQEPRSGYRLVNDDDLLARRSIARLSELGTFTMLPGHGRSWKGTVEGRRSTSSPGER